MHGVIFPIETLVSYTMLLCCPVNIYLCKCNLGHANIVIKPQKQHFMQVPSDGRLHFSFSTWKLGGQESPTTFILHMNIKQKPRKQITKLKSYKKVLSKDFYALGFHPWSQAISQEVHRGVPGYGAKSYRVNYSLHRREKNVNFSSILSLIKSCNFLISSTPRSGPFYRWRIGAFAMPLNSGMYLIMIQT